MANFDPLLILLFNKNKYIWLALQSYSFQNHYASAHVCIHTGRHGQDWNFIDLFYFF